MQPTMGPPGLEMPPLYAPMPMIAPRPDRFLKIGALLLMIFLLVGLLAFHSAFFVGYPGSSDPNVTARVALLATFFVMMDVALAFTVFLALWTMAKPEVAEGTRRGLMLFSAVFLALWVFLSLTYLSSLLFFLRFP